MPKIMQTSWLAVLLATIAFYMIGFAWYGFIFEQAWLDAANMTSEQAEAIAKSNGAMMFVWGLLITLAQAIGVLMVIHKSGAKGMAASLSAVFFLFLTIAAPLLTYACLYQGYSLVGILVDFGHILVGYLVMAAIFAGFRRHV